MNVRLARSLVIVCGVLLLAVVPLAHAQPVPPDGDDYNAPISIALNSRTTVKRAEIATEQFIVDDGAHCDADNSSTNSVWFTFTVPEEGGFLDLDSAGSWEFGVFENSMHVVLVLFRVTSGLEFIACSSASGARLANVAVAEGGTYMVRFATEDNLTAKSQYRLSVRARHLYQLLQDPLFDNEELGTVWKAKKAGNPPKIFRDCSIECRVRFDGVAKGQLHQSVTFPPATLKVKAGDFLRGFAFVNTTPPTGADVKMTIKITYSDGTPAGKASATNNITNTGTGSSSGYTLWAEFKSKAVKNVKFIVSSPAAGDTFSVVSTQLALHAGSGVRGGDALPLPPSP